MNVRRHRRNRLRGPRRAVRRLLRRQRAGREAVDGRALVRGAGLVRRRALPRLVRHSQQPDDALRRDRRIGLGVSPAGQQFQRQHGRPSGPAGDLRASGAPRHRAPSSTGRSRSLPTASRASASTRPTTRWSSRTARSGSPIRPTASSATTRAMTAEPEIDGCHVYRVDPATGAVRRVADDFVKPNGLAFSSTKRLLYIADTGASHDPDGPRHIRHFTVGGRRQAVGRRGVCRLRRRPVRRLPRRQARAASGRAPATASTATTRTER